MVCARQPSRAISHAISTLRPPGTRWRRSNWQPGCGPPDYNAVMDHAPGTSRRQFLTGKLAGEVDSDALPQSPAQAAEETYLVQLSRRAMACEFMIYMNAGEYEAG